MKEASETHKQYLAAIVSVGVPFVGGMGLGWTSPVESQIVEDKDGTCSRGFCVSNSEFVWVASIMLIGSLTSVFFVGPIMSRVGRKPTLIASGLLSVAGWLLVTLARFKWMLFVGRFILGAGYGGSVVTVPLYIAEISQTSIRGRLAALFGLSIQSGISVTYVLGYFFSMVTHTAICTAILGVMSLALFFIPESPSFYVSKDKFEPARKALTWLRGTHFDTEKEIVDIVDFQSTQETRGFRTLFTERVNRKALLISLLLFSGYELSGINGVIYYSASILQEANINMDPNLGAIFVTAFSMAGTISGVLLMDQIGRRKILLPAYFIMFLCFSLMGIYFQLQTSYPKTVQGLGLLPVALLCVYCFCNGTEVPTTFVLMGEIFAQNVKDVAAGVSITYDYVMSITVTVVFPLMANTTGLGSAFFLFGSINALMVVLVAFFVPETKGKSFKEIQIMLMSGKKK